MGGRYQGAQHPCGVMCSPTEAGMARSASNTIVYMEQLAEPHLYITTIVQNENKDRKLMVAGRTKRWHTGIV